MYTVEQYQFFYQWQGVDLRCLVCVSDEIGSLLGEGTFGKVLDCFDR